MIKNGLNMIKKYCSILASVTGLCCLLMFASACDMAKNKAQYDRGAGKEQQDYRRALAPRPLPEPDIEDLMPPLEAYIATDDYGKPVWPLVSVSVNQTVSLRDLLFELAEQGGVDLEMDPQIRGTLIFTVRNRPFDEVIERIARMAGLRYRLDDNLLRVELDRPYVQSYHLNYLNFIRSVSSSIQMDVSVISETEATVGSSSEVQTDLETDFWADLESNLEQLLTASEQYISLATLADPQAQPRAVARPETVEITDPSQLPPPILDVRAPPAATDAALPNPPSAYSINRQAGIINVFTTERQHVLVDKYLTELKQSTSTQVLIEAKILEVSLRDEFATGINWDAFGQHKLTGLLNVSGRFNRPALSTSPDANFGLTFRLGSDIGVVVDALNQFGTVRALSSPRITVLNNQSAVLNVVENIVFFEFDFSRERDESGVETVDVSSNIRSVPEGVMMTVSPSVNPKTGEITMMLRPTVSKIADRINDPSISLQLIGADPATIAAVGDIRNLIPQLSVQEMDSVVKMQSGEVIVMGGLMTEQNNITRTGVPVLGNLPVIGRAFSSQGDIIEKAELVIFLKATIVPGSDGIHDTDRELYRDFGLDRRPFRL